MSFIIYGSVFETGELSTTTPAIIQPFKPGINCLIKAIRTTVILVNSPTFSNLKIAIYGANTNSAQTATFLKKLYISTNSQNLSSLTPLYGNGYAETYFEFSDVVVQKNTLYGIALQADSYTYSSNSYLAWYKDSPATIEAVTTGNFHIAVISAPL